MTSYTIKAGEVVLGTFDVAEVSDPAIASGIVSTLSLSSGTAVSVHATSGDDYLAIYDGQVVTVEAG